MKATKKYLERTGMSKVVTLVGNEIFARRNALPVFLEGRKLKPYQLEVAFKNSVRKWKARYDYLSDGSKHLIVFDKSVNF